MIGPLGREEGQYGMHGHFNGFCVSPYVSKAIIQYKKASIGGSSVEGMRVCGQREKQEKTK